MKKGGLTNKTVHFYSSRMDKLHFIIPENYLFIMMQFQGKQDLQEIIHS